MTEQEGEQLVTAVYEKWRRLRGAAVRAQCDPGVRSVGGSKFVI